MSKEDLEEYHAAIRERHEAEKAWFEQQLADRRKKYEAMLLEKIKGVLPEGTKDIVIFWNKD